jgi:DNA topoisomerase-3
MRLFIAEKPELARAIAEGLGGGTRRQGYIECGNDRVTWCFGHMLQLLTPEDYDPRYAEWSMDDLPIVNIPWRRKPAGDTKRQAQLKIVLDLLKISDSVVHAGDPDEEGQLLVDEILDYAGCSLPVERLLINDNNVKIVRRQLGAMRDNRAYAGLSAAAEARSVGDQLYGFNLTRGYTLMARASGYQGLASVGRVQTPVLGLVVRRCRENASHALRYFHTVEGEFEISGTRFFARYQRERSDLVDSEGRLSDAAHAARIATSVEGQSARVVSVVITQAVKAPPLPYNLLKLQIDAARKFQLEPGEVKSITQALREKYRLITYNRSDCQYLSEEQHGDAAAVLAGIADTAPLLMAAAVRANPSICGRAFNSAKVSAHHAIIPTENAVEFTALTEGEQKIYLLIARAYIAQFWPKQRRDQTEVRIAAAGHHFIVRTSITTAPGWSALYKNDSGNEDLDDEFADPGASGRVDLRQLAEGQDGMCLSAGASRGQTQPQALYTMASLLADLTRVARYIRDDRLREALIAKDEGKEGEQGGIGTPATRDAIIGTLFNRGYIGKKERNIIATPQGEALYDVLPDIARFPDMTAIWHEQQSAIKAGVLDVQSFVDELVEHIKEEIAAARNKEFAITLTGSLCPTCGRALRRVTKKDGGGFFWGCSGFERGCKFTCNDRTGRPEHPKKSRVSQTTRRPRRRQTSRRRPAGTS